MAAASADGVVLCDKQTSITELTCARSRENHPGFAKPQPPLLPKEGSFCGAPDARFYSSIEDLIRRVPEINKREIRALSLAGALNFDGTVHFIFQPAEEGLGGARAMILPS